jgi:hypothetical protein
MHCLSQGREGGRDIHLSQPPRADLIDARLWTLRLRCMTCVAGSLISMMTVGVQITLVWSSGCVHSGQVQ